MIRLSGFAILVFWVTAGFGQVISVYPNPWKQTHHPFNEKFISLNAVQKIEVQISTKREMDRIRSADQRVVFEFNKQGHITAQKQFKLSGIDSILPGKDTLVWSYTYLESGQISTRTEYLGSGYIDKSYRYSASGDLQQVTSVQHDLGLEAKRFITSIDSIALVSTDPLIQVYRYYNDYNLPYKEVRLIHDSLGYLVNYSERYLRSKRKEEIQYRYNEKGLLAQMLKTSNQRQLETKEIYDYDEFDRPKTRLYYTDGKLIKRREYLFRDDGSLKAILTKDMDSNLITIWEIRYITSTL